MDADVKRNRQTDLKLRNTGETDRCSSRQASGAILGSDKIVLK